MSSSHRIVVVGAGYVGLPAAVMWAQAGESVIAVDINEELVGAINQGAIKINEPALQQLLLKDQVRRNLTAQTDFTTGDVFVIAVPTPIDPLKKVADLRFVISAIESICPFLQPGNLVIVESTVPPLTCRNLIKPLIERLTGLTLPGDLSLAYCPERILPGNIVDEIINNDRIIGGIDTTAGERAAALYGLFVKGTLFQTDDLSAELAKLFENTYRDVNIALANEFASICDDLNVHSKGIIELANRHPRVSILKPGIGVGGHCIPFAPWFLHEVAPHNSRLITTGRFINDEMPHRVAGKIRRAVRSTLDPEIVMLGATYKKNCADTRESPALRIFNLLEEDGYRVRLHDPFIPGRQYNSIAEAATGADLLVVLVAHDQIVGELRQNDTLILKAMRDPRILYFDE